MPNNRSWFTLVEVLVSALILSVTVFGILRLTNDNSQRINTIEKDKESNLIYSNTYECLKGWKYDYLSTLTSTVSINFWDDNTRCLTWTYDDALSFSWITFGKSDANWNMRWDEFWNYINVSTGSNLVEIHETVSDWGLKKEYDMKIYK